MVEVGGEIGEVKCADGPGARITNQLLNKGVMVGRVCFVAGLQEDYFAITTVPSHDASADLAAIKPTKKYDVIRLWYINKFSVAFFLF